jgi:hypothetical protein
LLESKFADTVTRLMMSVPLSLRRSGLRRLCTNSA